MPDETEHAGMAALSICEALLLAMDEHGLFPAHEITGVLRDAATTHENATGPNAETHRAVAVLINRIIADRTSVRGP